ncbi:uncharacterized protein si:dkey-92i15.4 [Lampris incognitus]|uniref:uncharacterized protein si:dkey-92i15.4 n=1 Tax=Lampris incognitus TaxID=2546036 RepID=UPI0024B5EDDC|nr:uncharacterized protein si:dkey-92i15.4 [Lampris incognitus]XP_056142390.1 uncharacterized protein si:dkey-92i15.4 [Lampris incognitus]XP_056142391.1 uncharacterized protein si:dkey-92i15.4 [Lampris incognitus]
MDSSLHPTAQSEHKKGTRPRFTIRPANSPAYNLSLTRGRSSLGRPAPPQEARDTGQTRGIMERVCREKEQGPNKDDNTTTGNPPGARDCRSFAALREEKKASDPNMSHWSNQNSTGGEAMVMVCSDGGGGSFNPAPVVMRGRTEWRSRQNLPGRSKSLDWREGAPGPERDTGVDLQGLSTNQEMVAHKRADSLERREKCKGSESSVMSKVKAFNSAGTTNKSPGYQLSAGHTETGLRYMGPALERSAKGLSLPSRLQSQCGLSSASGLRETASSCGSKAGRNIWERIEKLYGHTGPGQTEDSGRARHHVTPFGTVQDLSVGEGQTMADTHHRKSANQSSSSQPPAGQWRRVSYRGELGGTFPRHFSKVEKNSLIPQQNNKTDACASSDRPENSLAHPASSVSSASPVPALTRDRAAAGGQRCGGALELGARSLDGSRGKHTTVAEIGSARMVGAIGGVHTQPHTVSEEGSQESFKDLARPKETGMSGSKDRDRENDVEGIKRVNGIRRRTRERNEDSGAKVEGDKGLEKGRLTNDWLKGVQTKGENGIKSSGLIKDVLESGTQKISSNTREQKTISEKMVIPSVDSVRNKINRFEALTQKVQGSTMCKFTMSRRAFSVPDQLSGIGEGVKKSRSERAIGGTKGSCLGLKEGGSAGDRTGEEVKESNVVKRNGSEKTMLGTRRNINGGEEVDKLNSRSALVGEVGVRNGNDKRRDPGLAVNEAKNEVDSGNDHADDFGKYCRLKDELEIPLNGGSKQQRLRSFYIDETDFCKAPSPEKPSKRDITSGDSPSSPPCNAGENSDGLLCAPGVQNTLASRLPSPVSDDDKTPTNTPDSSPFLSRHPLMENDAAVADGPRESSPVFSDTAPPPGRDPPHLLLGPLSTSSLMDITAPDGITPCPEGEKQDKDLNTWVTSLKIEGSMDDDGDGDDDDEGTEKDEDSNYDSDSAESSVTITSHMSQTDHRSFCVSLAELCNFGGLDYESENNGDEWSSGRRSASLSSDMSVLSCVSILPSEELDRLLEDVRGLGDNTLQNYDDVQVVVLHKDVGIGLGFSVAGGVDQNKPVTVRTRFSFATEQVRKPDGLCPYSPLFSLLLLQVHRVFPSGVAAQEGSIREGDHVLSINGTAMCSSAHWEALRTLRKAKTLAMAVVVLRRVGVCSLSKGRTESDDQGTTQSLSTNTGHHVCVRLEKQSRDLGFSLEGGVGSSLGDRPLSIQKIFQGGPVGSVCPGDELLEIQGVSMMGMRRLEAWTLIRRLPPGPVDVVLHRPLKPPQT